MNTATATHLIQTISALSIALLCSGTTSASHRHDAAKAEPYPHGYEDVAKGTAGCRSGDKATVSYIGTQPVISRCHEMTRSADASSPIRLAKPLSGSPYLRSGESIRYSF